jgi:hypothetical protein
VLSPALFRFGAISGLLCGLCIAVPGAIEAFTGETAATSFVLGFAAAGAAPLLVGLHLRQSGVSGRLGTVGYAVSLVGTGMFGGAAFALNEVLYYLDDATTDHLAAPTRVALLLSGLAFAVGSVLFGASMVRAGVHPRAAAWSYTCAPAVFALTAPLPDSVLTSALHVLVGLTIARLAAALWTAAAVSDTAGLSR